MAFFHPAGNVRGGFKTNCSPSIRSLKQLRQENEMSNKSSKFIEEIVDAHNMLRALHKTPALQLQRELNDIAQKKAEVSFKLEL